MSDLTSPSVIVVEDDENAPDPLDFVTNTKVYFTYCIIKAIILYFFYFVKLYQPWLSLLVDI